MLGIARFPGSSKFRYTDNFGGTAALASPWTLDGSWQNGNGVAVCLTPNASLPTAVIDASAANVQIGANLGTGGDALIFRYVDANNWWRVLTNYGPPGAGGSGVQLAKMVAGVFTSVSTVLGTGYSHVVRCVGNAITVTMDGYQIISTTSADLNTATKHGIGRAPSYWLASATTSFSLEAI